MTPVQKKYFLFEMVIIVCALIAILIAMFCPSLKTHCPECGHVPTIYQAQNTSFCPECGQPTEWSREPENGNKETENDAQE